MDDLDRKILTLLAKNARMPVKEIAEQVSLTSPAVSSRIHKLETDGIISGYTVTLNRPADRMYVDALISLSVAPPSRMLFWNCCRTAARCCSATTLPVRIPFWSRSAAAAWHSWSI